MGLHRKYSGTITRATSDATGSQSITGVGGKPLIVIFSAADDADSNIFSDGWDDGTLRGCTYINNLTLLATLLTVAGKSQTLSINVQTLGGAGHSASISSLDTDGFTLSWTKSGAGRNITVKYIAFL